MCMVITDKYIDPFTDFGFKWLFGNEKHKDILIDFLNALLDDLEAPIVNIEYRNLEKLGLNIVDRKAVFDIYCTDANGDHFIVELQRSRQEFFKDRSVYYTSFPIQSQAQKGDWNYKLDKVYFVGILEFNIDDDENYIKKVSLFDEYTKKQFYDKLTYYYIEMPKFKKSENELSNRLDEWLYILNNLVDLTDIPQTIHKNQAIKEFFDTAEFLKLTSDEQFAYQQNLKARLDYINVMRYAKKVAREEGLAEGREEGLEKGREEGRAEGEKEKAKEIAKNLLLSGVEINTIVKVTGLTIQEIEELKSLNTI